MKTISCDLIHNIAWGVCLAALLSVTPKTLQAQNSQLPNSQTQNSVNLQQDPSQIQKEPCSSSEARQFDFWIGDWDLAWEGGSGRNTVDLDYDGCVIRENFKADPDSSSASPLKGLSVSVYESSGERWRQTWVDNTGAYLEFIGEFANGEMTLNREFTGKKGRTVRQRMIFFNISENSLDWNWERSIDGDDWQVIWKIHYQRRNKQE